MPLDLYYMPASAPCRTVIAVAKELGVSLNLKPIDLMAGEQNKPEYLAINPQHCIPTLHDTETGFSLWESRAIITYLVNKYAPGHALYPTDPVRRAVIDARLYYDIGTLYANLAKVVYPQIFQGAPLDPEADKTMKEKLAFLDGFVANGKYVDGGDSRTVADLSILSSIGMFDVVDYDISSFANIAAWRKRLEAELPYNQEVNAGPIAGFKAFFEAKKAAAP